MFFRKVEGEHQHRAEAARIAIHIGELLPDGARRSDQVKGLRRRELKDAEAVELERYRLISAGR